jgi:alkaline phosphatase isozyme conversion protein
MMVNSPRRRRAIALPILFLIFMLPMILMLPGCSSAEPTAVSVANYGQYGSGLAGKLAANYPFRSPGSTQEKAAGDFIIKSFKDLGYQPIVTEFTFSGPDGSIMHSRNIAVLIPGSGFTITDGDGNSEDLERQVIIGAHYDTPVSAQDATPGTDTSESGTAETTGSGAADEPALADYDGIHDNASGIGALLTAAKEMKSIRYGYDVVLIAFGAGSSDQAGARYYASQMSASEIAATDAMYCIDSIYAGDKVYAHSGRNSLRENYQKVYDKRRKLYEATDVYYEFELYTHNNFVLYTNMSSIDVTREGFSTPVLYREWTNNDSDYVPFDSQGIPIVFFESFDYDGKTLPEMRESKNPAFGSTGGTIRGTYFDSASYLSKILNTTRASVTGGATQAAAIDQLTKRVNNVAFIILEAIRRGPAGSVMR